MIYRKRLVEAKINELFYYYPIVAVLGARQVVGNLFKKGMNTAVFDPVVDVGNARPDQDFSSKTCKHPHPSMKFNMHLNC